MKGRADSGAGGLYLSAMETLMKNLLKHERQLVLLILLFSAFIRVWVIARHPMPAGDGIASCIQLADNLNDGHGFTTFVKWNLYEQSIDHLRPEANRQPLLPLLFSALFLITGTAFLPAQLLTMLLGLCCLLAVWSWGRKLFGAGAALFMLFFLSFNPPFVWYSTQPDSLLLYTALLFLAMTAGDGSSISIRRAILLGAISGVAYLARTQGLMLAFSTYLFVLIRGGRKRFIKANLLALTFIVFALPWFLRNIDAFGSPLHTQNSQFLLNENHWSAWSVREMPPGPGDLLSHQGVAAVAGYVCRGVLRVLEPISTGTLHRGEIFGQPTLIAFLILSFLIFADRAARKKLLLPFLVLVPLMSLLVLHEHSGRYLTVLAAVVIGTGSAGLGRFLKGRSTLFAAGVFVVLLLPFVRPLLLIMSDSSVEKRAEVLESVEWIGENSEESDWVVAFPNVELFVWKYSRPTLTMPNDYEMLLWPFLEEQGVRFVVIDQDLPHFRPLLSNRWRRTPDGSGWAVEDPPPFLTEVFRSESGRTIIYEMTGEVPGGFMAVDSLPPDNLRALPPGGL